MGTGRDYAAIYPRIAPARPAAKAHGTSHGQGFGSRMGLNWCQRLITTAEDWDSDGLIEFLKTYLLRLEPHERTSAGDCSKKASELGLLNGAYSKTGHSTPKAQAARANDGDQADRSTFILSPLWSDESCNVPARREASTFLLSTIQAASPIEGEPMLFGSSTTQTECKREVGLHMEDNSVSVRGSQATDSYNHRQTPTRDRYPSLPSLRSNSIDISSSVDRLLGNETTIRATQEHTHPRPHSGYDPRQMISSERPSTGATVTPNAPSFTILHCGDRQVFLDSNHNVNANHILRAGGMDRTEVARLRAAKQLTVVRFVKDTQGPEVHTSRWLKHLICVMCITFHRYGKRSNNISGVERYLRDCEPTSGMKTIPCCRIYSSVNLLTID